MKLATTPAEFIAAIEDALTAVPLYLTPTELRPDVRPLLFKLGCVSDAIARSGMAELGQRDLLRRVTERTRMLANASGPRSHAEILAMCSESFGYLNAIENCRLPVELPDGVAVFADQFRWSVLGLASRAAFAQSTTGITDRRDDLNLAS